MIFNSFDKRLFQFGNHIAVILLAFCDHFSHIIKYGLEVKTASLEKQTQTDEERCDGYVGYSVRSSEEQIRHHQAEPAGKGALVKRQTVRKSKLN